MLANLLRSAQSSNMTLMGGSIVRRLASWSVLTFSEYCRTAQGSEGWCFQVYRGTELRTDEVTPTFWGRYERVICVGSLSKAFGLPGLRLGWLVGPPDFVEQVPHALLHEGIYMRPLAQQQMHQS